MVEHVKSTWVQAKDMAGTARLLAHMEPFLPAMPSRGNVALDLGHGLVVEGTVDELETWLNWLRWELLSGKVPGDVRCRHCAQELVIDYPSGTWVSHQTGMDCQVTGGAHDPMRKGEPRVRGE